MTEDVQGYGQQRDFGQTGKVIHISAGDTNTNLTNNRATHWHTPNQRSSVRKHQHAHQATTAHKPARFVRPDLKHTARYGCWLPFPSRRGWKEAGGIGGEKANKNTISPPPAGAKKCH
jgi:hypothetical protein